MSRLGEYTFLVTDLLTWEVKSVVELSSFYWDVIHNAPGSGLATARIDLPTTTRANFKDWATGLWAIQNGEIVYGGIVGKIQRRGGTRVISIPVHGFFEYFQNRILRSAVGMNHGQLVRTSDIEWRNVEQFHIFQDYILHAQHSSFPDGDLGAEVEWDALSGITRTSVRQQFTAKFIGAALLEIANTLSGFDFYTTYYIDSQGRPRFRFKLRHPQRSNLINQVLLFQPERTVLQSQTILRAMELPGASGDYAHAGDASHVVNDIDVRVHLEMDDWTPTSEQVLRSKWEAPNNKSWKFTLLTDGKLKFYWTTDGTTEQSATSDSAVSFTDNTEGTARATFDAYDEATATHKVTFFESVDGGQTWTSLTTDPYEATYSVRY